LGASRRAQEIAAEPVSATRWLGAAAILCELLILYGSLMPFDFSADMAAARQNLDRAWQFWPLGTLAYGRRELLVNVVLYVPLGLLFAAYWAVGRNSSRISAVVKATFLAAATSAAVESTQLFLPSRETQITDVVANTAGGMIGACLGAALGGAFWLRVNRRLPWFWQRRPLTLAAAVMLLFLVIDAWSPLYPVFTLSELRQNLASSHFALSDGLAQHTWHHWLVARIGVFAVFAVLLGACFQRRELRSWVLGAVIATAFAAVAESGKPFVEDREANSVNVFTSAAGALTGMILSAILSRRVSGRTAATLAAGLLLFYIAYLEWTPFNFVWDEAALQEKGPAGTGWLPLSSYALGDRHFSGVHKFLRMATLVSAFFYVLSMGGGRLTRGSRAARVAKATGLAALLGLGMELVQFFIPDRGPTTTEVVCFAAGGAIGTIVHIWVTLHDEGLSPARQMGINTSAVRAPYVAQSPPT
jgi:VanZ family protein